MRSTRLLLPLSALAVGALALAGCSGSAEPSASGSADADAVTVVASTDVYGQIAQEIGGDAVDVVSIIDSASKDPHEYEATAQDQLEVQRADLLIQNGGGYDSFMESMIDATGTDAPVITAVEFNHDYPGAEDHDHDHGDDHADDDHADEGDDHDHADEDGHNHIEGFNEHVWYDPHTVAHVAEAIEEQLSDLLPADAATFEANLATFTDGIDTLEASLKKIATAHSGAEVFVTEPVPVYLTTAAGLDNVTPEAFSEAVEEGQDVPPATLLEATKLLTSGEVSVVIVNAQTGGAETQTVIDTAKEQGIPVLEFTETLPSGQTYLSWMTDNTEQLADALS